MPRLKLTIAYVGTHYCGWQIQALKDKPHPPTVQAEIERALEDLLKMRVHVQGAGRTDSGVHADAQIAHCDVPESKRRMDWVLALNTRLPHDIRVIDYEYVPPHFNACFSVVRKAYTYSLWLNRRYVPPRLFPFVWHCGPLDMEKIDAAIPHLLGEHDFASMQNRGTELKSSVRTIFSITRSPSEIAGEEDLIRLRFESNGFLKQMVRNLVGLLAACGRGKYNPDDIPALLEAKDRRLAPFTAPPQGLTMTKVWYDPAALVFTDEELAEQDSGEAEAFFAGHGAAAPEE